MELAQVLDSLRVVQLPMRTKFRGITTREVALFQGPNGWGEFSPFLEYGDREAAKWLNSGVEAANGAEFPIYRDSIKVNGTIPATDSVAEINSLVDSYPGVSVFKVKVGSGLEADLQRLNAVKSAAPSAKIRIDVNGSWSVTEAERNIKAIIDQVGALEYIEQPVSDIQSLRELKRKLNGEVLIAGDEVIRKSQDPLKLELLDAIDILMLKVAPLGGIEQSLEIANHHKLPVVVSSALESAVGTSHELRLAAALPNLDYACGLATGALFESDLATHELRSGEMKVKEIELNLDALVRFAAPKERLEWWRRRIKNCWEVLA
jgi:O-succinylbenzoate synthase